ncbi:MAG TPA: DUF4097 family beta strand repeat-containing protein, partial [Bacteroidota bacterium]|nr:DUF4097 family beta strand repeat-containing protein [Bacteroidota bacterium]
NHIDLDLNRSPAKLDIQNEYGNVTIRLPKSYSGELNLKVSYGKIVSDLPIKVEDLGGGAFFVGKLGDKKNEMAVSTSSGNIYLEYGGGKD